MDIQTNNFTEEEIKFINLLKRSKCNSLIMLLVIEDFKPKYYFFDQNNTLVYVSDYYILENFNHLIKFEHIASSLHIQDLLIKLNINYKNSQTVYNATNITLIDKNKTL